MKVIQSKEDVMVRWWGDDARDDEKTYVDYMKRKNREKIEEIEKLLGVDEDEEENNKNDKLVFGGGLGIDYM